MNKINIYLASHFFDAGGRMKTQLLADEIRKEFGDKVDLYVPQENGDINDKSQAIKYVTDVDIARGDNERLDVADVIVADLDGVETDSGVVAELAKASGRNDLVGFTNLLIKYINQEKMTITPLLDLKPTYIIGFTTDIRINTTTPELLQDLDSVEKVDNVKDNHLYRNLYVRGLVKENGVYVATNPDNYVDDIIKEIHKYIEMRG